MTAGRGGFTLQKKDAICCSKTQERKRISLRFIVGVYSINPRTLRQSSRIYATLWMLPYLGWLAFTTFTKFLWDR